MQIAQRAFPFFLSFNQGLKKNEGTYFHTTTVVKENCE